MVDRIISVLRHCAHSLSWTTVKSFVVVTDECFYPNKSTNTSVSQGLDNFIQGLRDRTGTRSHFIKISPKIAAVQDVAYTAENVCHAALSRSFISLFCWTWICTRNTWLGSHNKQLITNQRDGRICFLLSQNYIPHFYIAIYVHP